MKNKRALSAFLERSLVSFFGLPLVTKEHYYEKLCEFEELIHDSHKIGGKKNETK